MLGRDEAVLAGIATLLAPGGEGAILVSVVPRDGVTAVPGTGELAAAYARHGLELREARPATLAELQDSMRPVEVGDPELRKGLAEVRELLGDLRPRARELLRVLGR